MCKSECSVTASQSFLSSKVKLCIQKSVKTFGGTRQLDLLLSFPLVPFDCQAFHITPACSVPKEFLVASNGTQSFSPRFSAIANFLKPWSGTWKNGDGIGKDSVDVHV